MHAETMLLVDDREAEIAKGDAFLEQGVGADGQIDLAPFQRRQRAFALGGFVAPRQNGDAQPGRFGERAHALEMLAGEDFGRRHQRRLPSGLDDAGHGEQRDDGFSRADVALQQPQHALWRGEIGADFGQRFRLRPREAEGQGGLDLRGDAPLAGVGAAGEIAHARAHHQQRELIGEQFVIGESRRRRGRRDRCRRALADCASPPAPRRKSARAGAGRFGRRSIRATAANAPARPCTALASTRGNRPSVSP